MKHGRVAKRHNAVVVMLLLLLTMKMMMMMMMLLLTFLVQKFRLFSRTYTF